MWYWLIFDSRAIWRGSSPWCETPWKPEVGASLSGYVRPVRSRAKSSVRDVGLERQGQQVELQLDVLVERLRDPDRHGHVGRGDRGRLHRDLQPALDLAHVLGIVVQTRLVGRADLAAQAGDAA